ncbi:hypothetical protein HK097_001598 [Rhizophlyctis rosea]|uniref:Glycolipid transfer protein domain-containing protein n=1 Tax=Rhizophlyctis rosea TaxID=64517 RepID=A0AAD5SHC5_9FUNG|nr:hypothetical protein HK097_001598 [Rhizophlyctis rosea]
MTDYFRTIKKSFADVPIGENDHIEVPPFLEASEELIRLFDSMGASFGPVKSDLQGNVNKIRAKYLENPTKYNTLQNLVIAERAEGKKTATEGLLWLKRGLEFTATGLRRNLNDKNEELNVSFQRAYEQTLSQYHNFLVKPVFSLAMKACPYRKDFYAKLGSNTDEVYEAMLIWLGGLERDVAILNTFYTTNKYDKF